MKIVAVETFRYWIKWCAWLFVRVTTDEGLVGWGEGSLHGAIESVETAIRELGATLIGKDPAGVEAHWQRMYHAWRWRGGPTLMTGIGALDLALWDLEGKRLGVPCYRLFGGPYRTHLPVYASHWLAGARTPEEAARGARTIVERGFRGFKWSPFDAEQLRTNEAAALSFAAEMMAAAREGAGEPTEIYVECSERLSRRTAILAAKLFAPYRPGWFEEPIPFENPRAMADLAARMPLPIATGERLLTRWEIRELLERGGCAVLQPDVMHAGGLTEVRRMAAFADTYGVSIAPHNPGGPICALAAMHLAASIPNFLVLEEMEEERTLRDAVCPPSVVFENGAFVVPDRPGLGAEPLLDRLAEHGFHPQPVADSTESLWR